MEKENEAQLNDLSDIRAMMEESSKFISLSGLSGVFAGIFALAGSFAAYLYLDIGLFREVHYYEYAYKGNRLSLDFVTFFVIDAFSVLILSVLFAWIFTSRKAKQKGYKLFDRTTYRLLFHLLVPLFAGGVFCIFLLYNGAAGLVAPATLIFYGMALLNAGKYTLNDVKYLGIFEILTGLLACFFIGQGLLFWAFGFGVLHIVYGIIMYYKYER